jgi:hypothetical protein
MNDQGRRNLAVTMPEEGNDCSNRLGELVSGKRRQRLRKQGDGSYGDFNRPLATVPPLESTVGLRRLPPDLGQLPRRMLHGRLAGDAAIDNASGLVVRVRRGR